MRREEVARERARRRAEVALERQRLLHDERHLLAEQHHRRRDLGGDVGAADDHDALGVAQLVAQLVGIAERADVVDAVAHPAFDLEAADPAAGRDERLREPEWLTTELRGPRIGVHVHHRRARAQLDVVLGVPARGMDERRRPVLAALQIALRQRRAVVRGVHLAGHEDDRALEAALAQLRCGVRRGDAAADQQDVGTGIAHGGNCMCRAVAKASRGRALLDAEAVQQAVVAAPAATHAHGEVEVDVDAELALELAPGGGADRLDHAALGADQDPLL